MKQQGYTLAAALVLIAILSIFMALSVPIWTRIKQRENEEELIFRGKEYIEAIARYHARFHTFPPDLDTLYKQKFIRKLYKDPMTDSGKWKVLHPDSLVQTGAAGQINQPGQQLNPNESEDQNKVEKESEQPRTSSGNQNDQMNKDENTENSSDTDADTKDQALEEPETESNGPVVGVVSRSRKTSIKIYNNQSKYNKWVFVFTPQQQEQQEQQPPGKTGKPPKGGTKDQKPPGKIQPSKPQQNNQQSNP